MWKLLTQNNKGNQKAIMLALIGVALILVVLVVIDIYRKPAAKAPVVTNQPVVATSTVVDYTDVTNMTQEKKDEFRADVPTDIVVPTTETKLTEEQKKEIAIPSVVVAAAPGVSSKFRSFKITAEGDKFIPTKVIANVGDTVHIDFTALDKAYDIVFPSYNMMQNAKQGETRILEFQALQEGSFTYYCSSCGGPEAGPKGNIIIVQ